MYLLSLHDFSTQFQIPYERTLIRFQVVCEQYKLLQCLLTSHFTILKPEIKGGGGVMFTSGAGKVWSSLP